MRLKAICVALIGAAAASSAAAQAKMPDVVANQCATCHGADGNGVLTQPAAPHLAGQFPEYLLKQLKAFRTSETGKAYRENPVMTPIANGLSAADEAAAVNWYWREIPATPAPTMGASVERGRKIYFEGRPENNLPACVSCHRSDGGGIKPDFPRIAGQNAQYVEGQLATWKQYRGGRGKLMTIIVGFMQRDDMHDVAAFISGLK